MTSMKKVGLIGIAAVVALFLYPVQAMAWDPQPTNPFPGVAFGAEIPGYTVTVPCQGGDCGIGIVPVIDCPPWSAADGADGYTSGSAKRFCRNSWTPPTSAADDEDFRNRQQLAVAAATLESQNYNTAHPGEQKCVTWGPIVHANGISTASGGVCANPVGTKPDGSTSQVAPSPVSSNSSGTLAPATPTDSTTVTSPSSQSAAQASTPSIDLTQFGIGRPFTTVVRGNLGAAECPSGFQAASNSIPGVIEGGATECWPANAWAAYSIGGDVWQQFKSSNGSIDAQAEASRRIQVNANRALALTQAQTLANQTPGIKRCNSWSAFGESGQECAYIPIQNNVLGQISTSSAGDTSTSVIARKTEVVVVKISSSPGQTQAAWENSDQYKNFSCPIGSGRAISIDLNGTVSQSDDVWTLSCVQVVDSGSTINGSDSAKVLTLIDSSTAQAGISATQSNLNSLNDSQTATTISADVISVSGTIQQIVDVVSTLEISSSESKAISSVTSKLISIKPISKLVKISLPNSSVLTESAKSLTPNVCKVAGLVIQPQKVGTCLISYGFEGESGNSFETTKKISFKK